nr:Gag-Pol polyprotein [Tanacetum cinerariifolium]
MLIHNSILNGPYVRRMIPEPGDANRDVNVTETFHEQTDDELSEKELKQIEADDQAIQTILLGLPEDIYAAVDREEGQVVQRMGKNYLQQPMPNPEDITDSTIIMNMALSLMAKAFKVNYSTPTNNNQRISSNPRNRQIAQPGMNMGQDKQMQMIGVQNVENQVTQNPRVQNDENHNQIGNGNLMAVRVEGNAAGHNGNQIR